MHPSGQATDLLQNTRVQSANIFGLLLSEHETNLLRVSSEYDSVTERESSAESIPTLKNRESIHFDFLLRGFVEKE